MDRAVYWVEHIVKFGGKHLRAEVFNLNFVQYHMIDVYAFLAFLLFFLGIVPVYLLCSLFCARRKRCVSSKVEKLE